MEDKEIVDLFWERSESAINETNQKYGRYCHYIAYQILHSDEDAEEIVNDTYLKTWNTIPNNRPNDLKSYVGMISRQLAVDVFDYQHAQKRNTVMYMVLDELSACIPDDANGDEIGESVALSTALNDFLWSLPQKTRDIFVRRYWYSCSISEISDAFAMKDSAVTMLLHRTRLKLKAYLQEEDFNL